MTGRTYSDQQWGAIGALVERAGGVDARDKFDAERDKFEKMAGGWRKRIASWNGSTLRRDENDAERFRETLRRQVLDEFIERDLAAICQEASRSNRIRGSLYRTSKRSTCTRTSNRRRAP